MNRPAPLIETDRLVLDRVTGQDAGLMLAIWNDPEFIRHVGDRGIRSEEQALSAIREKVLPHYEAHGYGPCRVSLRSDGTAIGVCGLFKRENLDLPDIGYALLPAYRGGGYCLEAAQAIVGHARDDLKLPRLLAIVSPRHDRSIALLEKLGMRAETTFRMPGENDDVLLFGMDFEH